MGHLLFPYSPLSPEPGGGSAHRSCFNTPSGGPRCLPAAQVGQAAPTPLSHSSMASPSPAVLLKLLVLEEEREMLAWPISFNFMKGLQGGGKAALVTRGSRGQGRPRRD